MQRLPRLLRVLHDACFMLYGTHCVFACCITFPTRQCSREALAAIDGAQVGALRGARVRKWERSRVVVLVAVLVDVHLHVDAELLPSPTARPRKPDCP